ncbi:hypothetical protein [Mesorhizobium neociceri]|uniref:Phosphoribosyltransferase n=1 Tax=Mesorhizobium neociceri TaxID=1307853 RepID=A0A838B9P3_9HYPH|nr:hypothetical protein [Mesorhizobium neociceri]MBA1142872.1 hypothetical protein [Mesorhizobium neociceri]
MSARFTKIDDLTRGDHGFLVPDDYVLYLGEYTAHGGYKSETNNHILNFKMSPTIRDENVHRYKHKARSTDYWAEKLRSAVLKERLPKIAWCPIPCSKPIGHPAYDDRLLRLINRSFGAHATTINCIIQHQERIAAHDTNHRPDPESLKAGWTFQTPHLPQAIDTIAVFDDVIARGASFKAAQALLHEAYPHVEIKGVFLARVVHDDDQSSLFDILGE